MALQPSLLFCRYIIQCIKCVRVWRILYQVLVDVSVSGTIYCPVNVSLCSSDTWLNKLIDKQYFKRKGKTKRGLYIKTIWKFRKMFWPQTYWSSVFPVSIIRIWQTQSCTVIDTYLVSVDGHLMLPKQKTLRHHVFKCRFGL